MTATSYISPEPMCFLPFFQSFISSWVLVWLVFTRAFSPPTFCVKSFHTVYECHLMHKSNNIHEKNVAYLFFFISLHLLCFQQEHLKIKHSGMKWNYWQWLEALQRVHTPALSFSVLSQLAPSFSFCSLPASRGKSISIKMRALGKMPALRQRGSRLLCHWTGERGVTLF